MRALISSSISVFALLKLPGREFDRLRDGDGSLERMRVGESTEVERLAIEEGRLWSSWRKGRLDKVAETGLVLVMLCTLERRELDPTGFR